MKFAIESRDDSGRRWYEWRGLHVNGSIQISASVEGRILINAQMWDMLSLEEAEAVADVIMHAREIADSPAMFDGGMSPFRVRSEAEYPRRRP